ncbi:MAG: flagellin [Bdellovibrionota bacterium]
MAITIGSNITSLKAQRQLTKSTAGLSATYSRLSSGLRINKASDDAAGLAIADSLKADQRVAAVAIRNANDGISTIAIADGALSQVSDVLTRLAELAEQSANGVYSTSQRNALQNEFSALGSEIQRIATTTEFNGVKLLDGAGSGITLQVGFDSKETSRISITNVAGTLQRLGIGNADGDMTISISGETIEEGQAASRDALDKVNLAIGSLASTRGNLGAVESRLSVTINNLEVAKENFASAESQIRDVDVASEAAELTRLNILQQAGASVLAQANQQPAIALSLLA